MRGSVEAHWCDWSLLPHLCPVLAYASVAKDVKPENIMISGEKPEITLVDFGLAMDAGKEVEEGATKPTSSGFDMM